MGERVKAGGLAGKEEDKERFNPDYSHTSGFPCRAPPVRERSNRMVSESAEKTGKIPALGIRVCAGRREGGQADLWGIKRKAAERVRLAWAQRGLMQPLLAIAKIIGAGGISDAVGQAAEYGKMGRPFTLYTNFVSYSVSVGYR